ALGGGDVGPARHARGKRMGNLVRERFEASRSARDGALALAHRFGGLRQRGLRDGAALARALHAQRAQSKELRGVVHLSGPLPEAAEQPSPQRNGVRRGLAEEFKAFSAFLRVLCSSAVNVFNGPNSEGRRGSGFVLRGWFTTPPRSTSRAWLRTPPARRRLA